MSYHELIKSMNPIRRYVRDFFVLGCKSRDDFSEMSGRSYDNILRRVKSWLEQYLRNPNGKQKKYALSIASHKESENPLYRIFCTKTFTKNDLLLHFFLIDLLEDAPLRISSLDDKLNEIYPIEKPDVKSIENKCNEYANLGIFKKIKSGTGYAYALSNPLPLTNTADALSFSSETMPVGVLGFYLHHKAETPSDLALTFKHRYLFQALDEEISYTVLSAIRERKAVEITMEENEKRIIFPAKLYISRESGREYVLCTEKESPYFLRLDKIETAKLATDSVKNEIPDIVSHVWGVSDNMNTIWHVKMTVRIDPEEEFIVRRLTREKRCGTVSHAGENFWTYEADITDPLEMIPWFRTYIGRIIRLESDHPDFIKRFKEDLMSMWDPTQGLSEITKN